MPSPFPGMDPYLERPSGWLNVHNRFATYLADALTPRLVPRYVADTTEYIYVASADRSIAPDAFVVERRGDPPRTTPAVAEIDAPVIVDVPELEAREAAVQIIETATGRVVTVIELLSPSNKAGSGPARELYERKHRDLRETSAHLVEIDLLRAGRRTLSASDAALASLEPFDYVACVQRAEARSRFELWPVTLRQRLPRIAIPLLAGDADVAADLQAVLDAVYDRGAFGLKLDYRADPPPPALSPDDAAWLDALLREQGLR